MRPTAILASVLVIFGLAQVSAAAEGKKPNVLFFLIDDMGYADLSCFGQKKTTTPHIDQMAAEGIKFTQFYVNAPICSPSRTAIMTGQYPARWKIVSYLANRKENNLRGMAQWLDIKAPTMARAMHEAGYTTGHFGKWHMGGQRDVGDAPLVTEYGFDKSITSFEGLGDRYLPLNDAFNGKPAEKYSLGSENLGHGNITWIDRSKMTRAWADAALAFMKDAEKQDKPFYVDLWPDDVHSPFFPPSALRGDGEKETLYLGVVKELDNQVATLLDAIRNDPKLRDNTIVVIASDNGPEPGAGSAGPYKGHKGNLYEGGFKEPFIVWAPGLMPKSAVGKVDTTSVIAGMDMLPSLCAITGVKVPDGFNPDGEDRSKAMLGTPTPRTTPIFWVRPPDRPSPAGERWPDLAERNGDMKLLCDYDGGNPLLYDLKADPTETTDLAASKKEVVEKMKKEVLGWLKMMPESVAKIHDEPAKGKGNANDG